MTTPATPTEYVVLRTVANGEHITHLPTSERVIATDAPITDYQHALALARAHRTDLYRHRVTREERVLTEAQTVGCANAEDSTLFRWVSRAERVKGLDYALPLDRAELGMFEPKPAR